MSKRRVTGSSRSDDIRAVEQLAAGWRSRWLAGDTAALLDLYVDKPVLMPQGQVPVVGKDAIHSLYEAVFKEVTIKSEDKLMEVEVSGDLGYFWSTYRLTAAPRAGGAPIESEGKSVFIYQA